MQDTSVLGHLPHDERLAGLFKTAATPPSDAAFVDGVMRRIRRQVLGQRLVVGAGACVACLALWVLALELTSLWQTGLLDWWHSVGFTLQHGMDAISGVLVSISESAALYMMPVLAASVLAAFTFTLTFAVLRWTDG